MNRISDELMNLFRSKPAPRTSRDQTRMARARWAEIALKLHARPDDGRFTEPSTAPQAANDFR